VRVHCKSQYEWRKGRGGERNQESGHETCPKCGQAVVKLPDGKYHCGCQVKKDFNEEGPCLDLGEDIRGFV